MSNKKNHKRRRKSNLQFVTEHSTFNREENNAAAEDSLTDNYIDPRKRRRTSSDIPYLSAIQKALGTSVPCILLPDYLRKFYKVPEDIFNRTSEETGERSEHAVSEDEESLDMIAKIVIAPFRKHAVPKAASQRHKFSPDISEQLESIVDGVIASLVHRSNLNRKIPATTNIVTAHKASSEHQVNLSKNVLSSGYYLANNLQNREGHGIKSYCINMPPGIACKSPNTVALYAKTSPIMLRLHKIVGDDIIRQILLNTIVLIPYPRENYLQLCGPPLFQFLGHDGRKRKERNDDDASMCDTRQKRRKRSQQKEAISASLGSTPAFDQLDPNEPLPRRRIFYCESYVKEVGLPQSHPLNSSSLNYSDLLNSMVKFKDKESGKFNRHRWKRLRISGIDMCRRLHHRHLHKCDYHRVLDRHCPLPDILKALKNKCHGDDDSPALEELVAAHTPSENVTSFLEEVLRSAFPKDFWGSDHNFSAVLTTVEKFIQMRRYEQMPLKAITKGIRVMDFLWLSRCSPNPVGDSSVGGDPSNSPRRGSSSDHAATTTLVQLVLRWLYVAYIIPLLRSTFYITDTEFTSRRVMYYRKPVWSTLRRHAVGSLLCNGHFTEVKGDSEANISCLKRHLGEARSIGLANLRLLPKKKGIRPIAMLSKSAQYKIDGTIVLKDGRQNRLPPPNVTLRPTFDILTVEQSKNPNMFGSGVAGFDQVCSLIRRFKSDLARFSARSSSASSNAVIKRAPFLYCVSVDIHHCYDNINQDYLFDLVNRMLVEDDYLIQRHCVLHQDCTGKLRGKTIKNVAPPEGFLNFHRIAERLSVSRTQSVFVDGVNCTLVKKERILEILKEHIFDHMVVVNGSIGPRFFLQEKGIRQGSVLSSLLCNIYYGDVEPELLRGVFDADDHKEVREPYLLVRIVDDFLLMTTQRSAAERFLTKMHQGIPPLGVEINKGKTLVNFEAAVEGSDGEVDQTKKYAAEGYFPWCGMLFDTRTCDVRVDYSRFEGSLAADSLTVVNLANAGVAFQETMKTFIRPRIQSLLFHRQVSTESTAQCNFYQAHLFCAVKTIHYVSAMEGGSGSNAMHVVHCIEDVIGYSYRAIGKRLSQDLQPEDSRRKTKSVWFLSPSEAQWLGRDAYIRVLSKAPSFKPIVQQLLKMKICVDSKRLEFMKRLATIAFSQFDIRRFALAERTEQDKPQA